MNFTILLAFLFSILNLAGTILKGLQANHIDFYINLTYVLITLIPLSFNFYYFCKRECFHFKIIEINLNKFFRMDQYNEYFMDLCESGKWLFCNMQEDWSDIEINSTVIGFDNINKALFSYDSELIEIPKLKPLDVLIMNNTVKFIINDESEFDKLNSGLDRSSLIFPLAGYFGKSESDGEAWQLTIFPKNREKLLIENEIYNDNFLNSFLFNNYYLEYSFRYLDLNCILYKEHLNCTHKNRNLRAKSVKHHLTNENVLKMLWVLRNLQNGWFVDGNVYCKGEVKIVHVLTIQNLIQKFSRGLNTLYRSKTKLMFKIAGVNDQAIQVNNNWHLEVPNLDNFEIADTKIESNLIETIDKLDFFEFRFKKLAHKFGHKLAEFLINYSYEFFEGVNKKSIDFLINRTSMWRYKDIGYNWKAKRFLTDVNFILKCAGAPQFTHIDSKIRPTSRIKGLINDIPMADSQYTVPTVCLNVEEKVTEIQNILKNSNNLARKDKKMLNAVKNHLLRKDVRVSGKVIKDFNDRNTILISQSDIKIPEEISKHRELPNSNNKVRRKLLDMKNTYKDVLLKMPHSETRSNQSAKVRKMIEMSIIKKSIPKLSELRDNMKEVCKELIDNNVSKKNDFVKYKGKVKLRCTKAAELHTKNYYEVLENYIDAAEKNHDKVDISSVYSIYDDNLGFGKNLYNIKSLLNGKVNRVFARRFESGVNIVYYNIPAEVIETKFIKEWPNASDAIIMPPEKKFKRIFTSKLKAKKKKNYKKYKEHEAPKSFDNIEFFEILSDPIKKLILKDCGYDMDLYKSNILQRKMESIQKNKKGKRKRKADQLDFKKPDGMVVNAPEKKMRRLTKRSTINLSKLKTLNFKQTKLKHIKKTEDAMANDSKFCGSIHDNAEKSDFSKDGKKTEDLKIGKLKDNEESTKQRKIYKDRIKAQSIIQEKLKSLKNELTLEERECNNLYWTIRRIGPKLYLNPYMDYTDEQKDRESGIGSKIKFSESKALKYPCLFDKKLYLNEKSFIGSRLLHVFSTNPEFVKLDPKIVYHFELDPILLSIDET